MISTLVYESGKVQSVYILGHCVLRSGIWVVIVSLNGVESYEGVKSLYVHANSAS